MPPTIIAGDLWDELAHADFLLVTTNSTIKQDGSLAMGRGAALQAAQRWPSLPAILGREIRELGPAFYNFANETWEEIKEKIYGRKQFPYWLVFADAPPEASRPSDMPLRVGAFQVKYHFRADAEPALIRGAAERLAEVVAATWETHAPPRIAMNFPGIGAGRLRREEVLPLLEPLPSCVRIYEYKEGR